MSSFDYKELRVKVGFGDDTDFALDQTEPADKVVIDAVSPKRPLKPLTVEFVVEWLDAGDLVVTGDRGSFDFQVVRVIDRPDATQVVIDSVVIAGVGNRAILIDDIRKDEELGVRLSNISAAAGATKMRVLYKESAET